MYCKNCGKQINDQARFCVHCGSPVIQEYKKPNNSKKMLYIGISILTIVAMVLVGILFYKPKEGKTYDDYMEAGRNYITEQDYDAAEDMFLKAYDFDPKQPEPYVYLYQIYEITEQPTKKEDILEKAKKNLSEKDHETFKTQISTGFSSNNTPTNDLGIELPDFDMTPIAYNDSGYIVRVNKKYGVIDTSGKWIKEPNYDCLVLSNPYYDSIPNRDTKMSYFLIKDVDNDGEMESIDYLFGNGSEAKTTRYGNGRFHQEGLYVDEQGKVYYLEDLMFTDGEEKRYYNYEEYASYLLDYNMILNYDGPRYLMINRKVYGPYDEGEIMSIAFKFNTYEKGDYGCWNMYGYIVNNDVHGLFYTKEDGKYRIHNADTLQESEELFDEAKVISENQIWVRQGNSVGIVGVDLTIKLISNQYEEVSYPVGNKAFVKENGKWKVVEIEG